MLIEILCKGVDVVMTGTVDDAAVVDTVRALCGAEGAGLGGGPVVLLGGGLERLRRVESALRAGLTRVHAVRTGAAAVLDDAEAPSDCDVIVVEQRWLPLLAVAPARAWVVLDDVWLSGDGPQVAALCDARHYAPTLVLCPPDRVTDALSALHLFRPVFLSTAIPVPAPTRVADPLREQRVRSADGQRRALREVPRSPDVAIAAERAAEAAAMKMSEGGSSRVAEAAVTFETLRAWRAKTARAAGVPPYRVLTDKQLHSLIELRPRTREEFLSVPGVGEKTWDHYGPDFLRQLTL